MLKRLIEVALPLKEVSEQSAREKSIRHGHISTLHIWWARRPLAACRAAVFASLIPDPDDPECPDHFRTLVMETLSRTEFKPKNGDGSTVEDTSRNRCLEFIKQLVKWENSNNPMYIEPARELITAAHKFLHPNAEGDAPKVLDPFAGGGAIPLEALRLGCEAHAVELNPVAHLIELCTLVYPQKYGQPNSRPVPEYIKRLIAHNKAKKRAKGEQDLFDEGESASASDSGHIMPDVEITEEEYCKNPLAADVKYWGHWVLEVTRQRAGHFYESCSDENPIAYLWARTTPCSNPTCRFQVPLIHQLWLANKNQKKIALRLIADDRLHQFRTEIVRGRNIDFDANEGTMSRTSAACPSCHTAISKKQLEQFGSQTGFGRQLLAVVTQSAAGKDYRSPTDEDKYKYEEAVGILQERQQNPPECLVTIPDEPLPYLRSIFNVHIYGFTEWGKLFNARQLNTLLTFCDTLRAVDHSEWTPDWRCAVHTYLALCLNRLADYNSTLVRWVARGEFLGNTFGRQALPMVWDHCEGNPFGGASGDWTGALDWILRVLENNALSSSDTVHAHQGDATVLPLDDAQLHCVVTDPPYYDSVPYADCSDFFYVWLKRTVPECYPNLFSAPLTPKRPEIVQLAERNKAYSYKTKDNFEKRMAAAFSEMRRVIDPHGVVVVVFAHKTTAAWETLVNGLIDGGLVVVSSWPLHTEMQARLRAKESAALASSIFMICRRRLESADHGIWDDVRHELKIVAQERLDFFWNQGIRGADFFISAIGPALSVFGKYERVTKLSGEAVTVGQFLGEVRSLVTSYALAKILKTTHTGTIDPESRFYVVWKWSYATAKVPADESFKLSQALGFDTASLWDRTGVLEKSGENVQASAISERIKVKNLGEPSADGTPASLIDVLHRMCAFREKGDTQGMGEFLARSGHANNNSLWLVAQAISEVLPDGDKEKQLMQGLLNQKDGLEEAARERRLF